MAAIKTTTTTYQTLEYVRRGHIQPARRPAVANRRPLSLPVTTHTKCLEPKLFSARPQYSIFASTTSVPVSAGLKHGPATIVIVHVYRISPAITHHTSHIPPPRRQLFPDPCRRIAHLLSSRQVRPCAMLAPLPVNHTCPLFTLCSDTNPRMMSAPVCAVAATIPSLPVVLTSRRVARQVAAAQLISNQSSSLTLTGLQASS
ncbi:hypothetical protein IG631_11883 [Alternaria alternata]|nr:hypothetical protein IG631_11883 [Alternaria alternata]